MSALDPQVLLEEVKCHACYSAGNIPKLLKLALLSRIAQNSAPVDQYDNRLVYVSGGVETVIENPTGAYDLTAVNPGITEIHCHNAPGITSLTCNICFTLSVLDLDSCPNLGVIDFGMGKSPHVTPSALTSVNLDFLTSCSFINFNGHLGIETFSAKNLTSAGHIDLSFNKISSLNLDKLESCPTIYLQVLTECTAINLPALNTGCSDFGTIGDAVLTSIPKIVLSNNGLFYFYNSALDSDSVDIILAAGVTAGMTAGIIDITGGTNSAPSVNGLSSKAFLIAQGVTVTTN